MIHPHLTSSSHNRQIVHHILDLTQHIRRLLVLTPQLTVRLRHPLLKRTVHSFNLFDLLLQLTVVLRQQFSLVLNLSIR